MQPQNSKTDEKIVISLISFLVILIVAAVTYSIYIFLDITHISNVAGVHVTKNFVLASKDVQGKLYSDPEKGIENWLVFSDQKDGFEVKYPNELTLQELDNGVHSLVLKKQNVQANGQSSLSMVVYVNVKSVSDSSNIKQQAQEMGIKWDDNWKQEIFGGKPGIRTGEIKDDNGIVKDMVIWQFGGKIVSLEADYLNVLNAIDNKNLFNKIVSEFNFI